jgi:PilZ domain
MVKTRIVPRFRVAKPARIEYDREKIDCVVRDLSATGSALEVANAGAIPVKFALVVPEDGLSLPCRVVWRRGFRLGVTFE